MRLCVTCKFEHVKSCEYVKLPAKSLPHFEGRYGTFSDSFKNIIHRNDNIAASRRFHYLRSALVVEVLQIFQNLPMTDVNCMIS
jgi:hypothetical protein